MTNPPNLRDGKHWLGFIASGIIAVSVDGGITKLFNAAFGTPILASRLMGISLSMIAGWLAHRRLTFRLTTKPSFAEFLKYAGVAWTAAAINYAAFASILYIYPSLEPLIALVFSSLVAMGVAYVGMRFAAFRKST